MMETLKVLGAPGRYIQGPGALSCLPEVIGELASSAYVLTDAIVAELLKADLAAGFEAAGLAAHFGLFPGECTRAEIERQTELARGSGSGVVVGVGGGKTIDTAKGISLFLGLPMVVVPTVASNDAPTSRLIVVYDDQHRTSEVLKLPRNPDVVVADTKVIASAPPRFLIAGIGDAVAKKFEAGQCALTGARNFFGGLPTKTALLLCESCYTTIREFGPASITAVRKGEVDESVENIVEATVLLSGLGFESGGLALAHSLNRGLTAQPETQAALHGELVAWGLLVQLLAEGRDAAFVDDMLGFYREIGLPVRLTDLGLSEPENAVIDAIAQITFDQAPYVANMERKLGAADIAENIRKLEALSA
ncbi:MAG: glycerol dehydrogenase [Rhodospirillaceae bacterium]|jgi:glycerol dehydrogenase|nr:glycerol dehydrogenase [Rhodospirillaceae bacterium]MBT6512519.1 glycerol dehydrogenase [Rhodospirillaceae bacterium]MBT7613426.1 glycerol dehydrogenase [Rhodospirillaceae bacterium]MBT7647563.1 glycerol dehydrogenase [Rhodospirillaceae bacterium]